MEFVDRLADSGSGTSSLVWRLGCRDTGRYGRAVLGPPSVALRHLPPVSIEALAGVQKRLAHFIPVTDILKARLQWERGVPASSCCPPLVCAAAVVLAARAALTQADSPTTMNATMPSDIDPSSGFRLPLPKREDLSELGRKHYDQASA